MKTIGWIGTGVMGQGMVNNLLKAGYNVNVFNRTISKTKVLVDAGAILCNSIAELTKKSDIIVTIIGMPKDIEQVYFEKGGILENIREGQYVVDMTTTSPTLSIKIYNEFKKKNISTLDAPVSGGDIGAKSGNLAIMIGGDEKTYNKIYPIFDILGANIVYEGKAGSGQHTKMANQISIAGNTIALCESLIYAEKVGLNLEKVSKIIASGAGGSWGWTNLSPRILKGELDTCFFVKHFVKDMGIVLEESRKMNLSLPGLSLVNQLYISLLSEGGENLGTQALIKVLKKLNNM